MPNGKSFPFVGKSKEFRILSSEESEQKNGEKIETIEPRQVSYAFSHLFNAYAQYFNKKNKRTGALFETPFKRKQVNNFKQFKTLVFYIHNNPVKHGFTDLMVDYPWSSYLSIISLKSTKLNRESVIGWFDGIGNFKDFHNNPKDMVNIRDLLFN